MLSNTNTLTFSFLRLTTFFNIAYPLLYHVFSSYATEMIGDSLCKYYIVLIKIYSIFLFLFFQCALHLHHLHNFITEEITTKLLFILYARPNYFQTFLFLHALRCLLLHFFVRYHHIYTHTHAHKHTHTHTHTHRHTRTHRHTHTHTHTDAPTH